MKVLNEIDKLTIEQLINNGALNNLSGVCLIPEEKHKELINELNMFVFSSNHDNDKLAQDSKVTIYTNSGVELDIITSKDIDKLEVFIRIEL